MHVKGFVLFFVRNGKGWIHVSCALWIPEVGFGNVEKMEPITRVENVPVSTVISSQGVTKLLATFLC